MHQVVDHHSAVSPSMHRPFGCQPLDTDEDFKCRLARIICQEVARIDRLGGFKGTAYDRA